MRFDFSAHPNPPLPEGKQGSVSFLTRSFGAAEFPLLFSKPNDCAKMSVIAQVDGGERDDAIAKGHAYPRVRSQTQVALPYGAR